MYLAAIDPLEAVVHLRNVTNTASRTAHRSTPIAPMNAHLWSRVANRWTRSVRSQIVDFMDEP